MLTFAVTAACRVALMQTAVGQQALVDQWERMALAFGREVSDEQYEQFVVASDHGAAYAVATALAAGPVLVVAVAAIAYAVFGRTERAGVSFNQVLAITAHAAVILGLREVVTAPINYASETLASPATLGRFFVLFDEASPAARFLGAIDLFVVWWTIVLGIGVALLYRRPVRGTVALCVGAYIGFAAVLAIAIVVSGGTV